LDWKKNVKGPALARHITTKFQQENFEFSSPTSSIISIASIEKEKTNSYKKDGLSFQENALLARDVIEKPKRRTLSPSFKKNI